MVNASEWWGDFTSGPAGWATTGRKFAAREDNSVYAQAQRTAVYFGNFERAAQVARMLADESRPPSVRALAWTTLAELALAQGRTPEADSALDQAERLDPVRGLERRALLTAVSPHPVPDTVLHALLIELGRHRFFGRRDTQPDLAVQDRVMREAPEYLAGLLAARSGDSTAASAYAQRLETAVPGSSGRLRYSLARSIRALLLSVLGHEVAALGLLESVRAEGVDLAILSSAFGPVSWQRYLRARLLAQQRRFDESLAWYETMASNNTFDLVFLGPALLAQAEILEARGNPQEARRRYGRLTDLWDKASQLQPGREKARAAVERLK
jgi:tetratricopeptide (TPR) repeat protein